jgi:MFS transporter, ACS family, glucarate transporter
MGGALNTAAYVGGSLSGIVFGYVANLSGSSDRPLIIMALVLGIGALLWLKIDPTRQLAFETTLEPSLPMEDGNSSPDGSAVTCPMATL